ncbi:GFA family protein [Novosphingobium subterraneum]|uniref:GFA family protein n=1 Tax=Novosphingobium subterraneum TaxID=48936 RepID=UPI003D08E4AE
MCWCRDCQRIASGSATVNVLFQEAAVAIEGELGTFVMTADSGNTVERGFCNVCGAQIYSRTVTPTGLPMRIRAGTLDDPELAPPTTVIWADSAPSWSATRKSPALSQRSAARQLSVRTLPMQGRLTPAAQAFPVLPARTSPLPPAAR